MKRFVTYDGTNTTEADRPDIRSARGWMLFYRQEVNKENYPAFDGWLSDMLKTGILSDITDKVLVYGVNKKSGKVSVIEVCNNPEEAEKFCESWGWSFDDGKEDYYMMIEDPDNKMFRVDVFGGNSRRKVYFDTPEEAREYGLYKNSKGNIAFLLQLSFECVYDGVEAIK